MLVRTRAQIDAAKGKTPAAPAPAIAPAPAPSSAPSSDNGAQLAAMQQAMTTMAAHMAQLPAAIASMAPPPRPTKLEAIPERDSKGRINRIIVHVIT